MVPSEVLHHRTGSCTPGFADYRQPCSHRTRQTATFKLTALVLLNSGCTRVSCISVRRASLLAPHWLLIPVVNRGTAGPGSPSPFCDRGTFPRSIIRGWGAYFLIFQMGEFSGCILARSRRQNGSRLGVSRHRGLRCDRLGGSHQRILSGFGGRG